MTWLTGLALFIGGVAFAWLLELIKHDWLKNLGGRRRIGAIVLLSIVALGSQFLSNRTVPNESPGHLKICAQTVGGLPAYPAIASLHSFDWEYRGAKSTDQTGCTELWVDLPIGDYNIELYSPGYDGAYWGGGRTRVGAGTLTSAIVKRTMPYLKSMSAQPPAIDRNQKLVLAFEVANLAPNEWDVRAVVRLKKLDKDARLSEYGEYSAQHIVGGNSSVPLAIEVTELETGIYSLAYSVETLLPWSRVWKVTHDTGWLLTLNVN